MNKRLKVALITLVLIIVILTVGFFYYVSNYYKADDMAMAVMNSQNNINFQYDHLILSSTVPSDTALIFYLGAKVEYSAYLPILDKIKDSTGITCILVRMPFNMAIFDVDRADEIIEQFPDIKKWYIGGHSMGGAMASNYASKNQDKVEGLILLASYIYGDYSEENTLTVYGTLNTTVSDKVGDVENIVAIEGGNHAQFGNYGKQKGDSEATISREEQQNLAVEAINNFLKNKDN